MGLSLSCKVGCKQFFFALYTSLINLKWDFLFCFLLSLCKKKIFSALIELCLRNLNALSSIGLIQMDKDINIKPTGRRTISWNAAVSCYQHHTSLHLCTSSLFRGWKVDGEILCCFWHDKNVQPCVWHRKPLRPGRFAGNTLAIQIEKICSID